MDALEMVQKAQDLLDDIAAVKLEQENVDLKLKQNRRLLEAEQMAVKDSITNTTQSRRSEIEEEYNAEAAKVAEKQKKIRSERSKAKAAGVRERIKDETADSIEEIAALKQELKTLYKTSKVPLLCRTTLFYSLHMPSGAKEFAILIVTFLITFLAIPWGIYALIPNHKTWQIVLLYLGITALAAVLYFLVGRRLQNNNIGALRDARRLRDKITDGRHTVKKITKGIQTDTNEEAYDLGEFDEQLSALEGELADIEERRKDALAYFDEYTRDQIRAEIEELSREKIETLERDIADGADRDVALRSEGRSLNLSLTDEYIPMIGKNYLEKDVLKEIEKLLQSGAAANLTDAKNLYEEQKQNR